MKSYEALISNQPDGLESLPSWVVVLIVALIVVAAASTKLAGLLFFIFLALGAWLAWSRPIVDVDSLLIRDWVFIAAAALAMRVASTVIWSDSWGGRHFDGRFFLMALAGWAIVRRCVLSGHHKKWITHALAMSCWVALGVVSVVGRDTPTNALPWAAGVSFMVCVLLGRVFDAAALFAHRLAWLIGSFAGSAAVLLSQSRGSYGILVWVLLLIFVGLWRIFRRYGQAAFWRPFAAVSGLIVVALLLQPRLVSDPLDRIQVAVREATRLTAAVQIGQVTPKELDTSVGARLYMWIQAADVLDDRWAVGVGQRQRQAWVKKLGEQTGSEGISSLDHLHSDPLTIWFEHGVLGLGSYLAVALGLLWLSWRARLRGLGLALGLGGLALMHITAGLTNFNTIHNFYGIMLSSCTLLAFWLSSTLRK